MPICWSSQREGLEGQLRTGPLLHEQLICHHVCGLLAPVAVASWTASLSPRLPSAVSWTVAAIAVTGWTSAVCCFLDSCSWCCCFLDSCSWCYVIFTCPDVASLPPYRVAGSWHVLLRQCCWQAFSDTGREIFNTWALAPIQAAAGEILQDAGLSTTQRTDPTQRTNQSKDAKGSTREWFRGADAKKSTPGKTVGKTVVVKSCIVCGLPVLSGQKRAKTEEGESYCSYCACRCTSVLLYADSFRYGFAANIVLLLTDVLCCAVSYCCCISDAVSISVCRVFA